MMTKRLILMGCLGILILIMSAVAQSPGEKQAGAKKELSPWMKSKLNHSQEIIASLATGDFEQIVASAQAMNNLSKIEAFAKGRFPKYRSQLALFQEANEEIIRQAEDKNLEGAALAFNQLTMSCIQCHKQLRKQPAEKE